MRKNLYSLSAFLTGAIIAVMVSFNTEFGRLTSSEVSLIINQIVGIITLHIIITAGRKNTVINPQRKSVKWYNQAFGGFFGVAIISLNYISVVNAGATISMAGAVFGQSLMGLIYDLTGFMGMNKNKIEKNRIIGILICLAGILIYLFSGEGLNLYIIPSIAAGVLTMTQMVYNSKLAKAKGAFYSARANVISGLIGALLYAGLFHFESTAEGFKNLSGVPLYIALSGGLLACIVVVSTNIVIPKISGLLSALLLSSGQIIAALVIDYVLYDIFSLSLIVASMVMLIGVISLSLSSR